MKRAAISPGIRFILILGSLTLVGLIGIGAMFYPLLSSLYMDSVRSEIKSQYQAEVEQSDLHLLESIREEARAYNRRLSAGQFSPLEAEKQGYYDTLLIPGGSRIMAYIHIPGIHVDLPVFHGVDSKVLESGCGHMSQSSLPVGGDSTHAVISAHTGMASSAMFSDLPLLKPGDCFQLEVLGETLTYEIKSGADIRRVLPVEVESIQIQPGEDLCTLVTCVPFGVNTHRLLVTGHRVIEVEKSVSPESMEEPEEEASPSLWRAEYLKSLWMGFGILGLILMIGAGIFLWCRFHKKGNYET